MNAVNRTVLVPSARTSTKHAFGDNDRFAFLWLIKYVLDNAGEIIAGTGVLPLENIGCHIVKNRHATCYVHNG